MKWVLEGSEAVDLKRMFYFLLPQRRYHGIK